MKYQSIFHLLANEFGKAKISFVLVGAFAVNYYKVPAYSTANLDLLMAEENHDRARSLLEQVGYSEEIKQTHFSRLQNRRAGFFMAVDVFFVDREVLQRIVKDGEDAEIDGDRFKLPSLNHLIALKLHLIKNNPGEREYRDLYDIRELIKRNRIDFRSKESDKLNLPIIRESLPPPPVLSMDRYVKFVEFCRRHVINQKAFEEQRKKTVVDVRFTLK